MKSKNIEIIFSTACFALLNVLFLISYYSVGGLMATAVTALFYFFRINYIGYKNNDKDQRKGVAEWLGVYLGAFAINALFVVAFKNELFAASKPNIELEGSAIFTIVLTVALLIALKKLSENGRYYYNFQFYLKYIVLFAGMTLISYMLLAWNSFTVVAFNFSIVAIAFILDCINVKNLYASHNTGFVYARLFLLIFNVMLFMYPGFGAGIVKMFINPKVYLHAPWYMYAIACAVMLICAVCVHLQKITQSSKSVDVRIYLYMASCAALMYLVHTYSTNYDLIFILIHALAGIAYILLQHKEPIKSFFGMECSATTLSFAGLMILSLLLPVTCYYGVLLQYSIICITVLGIYAFYALYEKGDKGSPAKTWLFWQFIVTMTAVFAGVVSYSNYNFTGNYVIIAFVYVIATLAFAIINCENKLLPKNHTVMRVIIAASAILFICLGIDGSKVKVTISVDNAISASGEVSAEDVNESRKVFITVDGKDDENTQAYCYWTTSESKVKQLAVGEDEKNTVGFRNGCLRIVIKDENGVVTTKTRWFFDKSLVEAVGVGTAR